MEVKTSEELESTGFRFLFESVKQEGIEPIFKLAQDIIKLSEKNVFVLVHQALINDEKNDLTKLEEKNKDIIRYLKEHKKELSRFSFTKKGVLKTIQSLYEDMTRLDIYLENARKLEALKVSDVKFVTVGEFSYHHGVYRDDNGNIIKIDKYYTDGDIITEREVLQSKTSHYSAIEFYIINAGFLLEAKNLEDFYQYRGIQITDFGFNGIKLPTVEEVQNYEIPKTFIK